MLFLFKALIGVAGIGAGVAVPVVVNKIQSSVTTVAEETGKVIGGINRSVTERRENTKVSEALGFLNSNKCKRFTNPANSNDSFGALYACKEDGKDSFYYLGSNSDVRNNGASSAKKVRSVNYEKGTGDTATLSLGLVEGNGEIKLSIPDQGGGGWANFKNVDLINDCKVINPETGASSLNCTLKDSERTSGFSSYNFSIF
ncbi:hypothetical protein DNK47_02560 [Mycoplasma wenyonii]|uniref:Uncharacterized protein n=1 Tax=Mycoplasma wenyonii TaxID=65123 RepID=A0A328PJ97_9MOLU|nr:hypothetical protein [Mycoplasma wenyonii]RAO94892.1 hypothetical protein DNK47_02560 [Mycoplasma wenyonii]